MEKCHLQSVVKWSKELRCFNFISSNQQETQCLKINKKRFLFIKWGNGILKLGLLIHDFFISLKHDFKNVRDLKRKTNNPTHVLHFSYYKKHLWPLWFEFQFRRHKCFRKLNWYRGLDKDRRSKMWQVQLHNESPTLW